VPRRTLATHHANGDNRARVNTEVLQRRIRALALSWPKTYEDEPWGHPVFKVDDNRMFAGMSSHEGAVLLTVKVTPEEREVALQLRPLRLDHRGDPRRRVARRGARVAARELLAARAG
jgi:YjbR